MSARVLITGAAGMLGQDVVRAVRAAGAEPVARTRAELDVTDAAAIAAAIAAEPVDAIVNCAAWANVDGAEADPDGARAANATAPGLLAQAAAAAGVRLVHVSTDYVFDGERPRDAAPYVESDPTGPQSVYGRTKLDGERAIAAAGCSHAIARTSWLFGVGGGNFAATMLRLASERDEISVVDDQIGFPTATAHLAPALVSLAIGAAAGLEGVVHVAGGGAPTSWHGFTTEIFRQAGVDCRVLPCTTAEMPRPARRPAFSALVSERDGAPLLPPWQEGLSEFLHARKVPT